MKLPSINYCVCHNLGVIRRGLVWNSRFESRRVASRQLWPWFRRRGKRSDVLLPRKKSIYEQIKYDLRYNSFRVLYWSNRVPWFELRLFLVCLLFLTTTPQSPSIFCWTFGHLIARLPCRCLRRLVGAHLPTERQRLFSHQQIFWKLSKMSGIT